ncbi:MAG TPA: hypothetical protein VF661_14640 [Actinomycetales bacterium]
MSPASAAAAGGSSASPAAYCRASFEQLTNPVTGLTFGQYVIDVEFSFGGQTVVEEFGLSSFQACVSTVAAGMGDDGVVAASAISKPAYLAQCDFLQRAGVVTYPYAFYGVYPAKNRADCARILQGVHSGTLPLPGPPPVG